MNIDAPKQPHDRVEVKEQEPGGLIGLSLTGCVVEIARGKIKVEDVKEIRTSIKIENEEDLEEIIERYSHSYWMEPEDDDDMGVRGAAAIVRQLFQEGKLVFVEKTDTRQKENWLKGEDENMPAPKTPKALDEDKWFQ